MVQTLREEPGAARYSDLARYGAMARRWWWLLVVGAAAAAVAAYFVTRAIEPTYAATTTLLVNQSQQSGTIAYNDILASERLTRTYAEMINKQPILAAAAEGDGTLSAEDLKAKLSTSVVKDTQLVRVTVKDRDPQRAASLADRVAEAFIESESSKAIVRPGTTSVVEPAKIPETPVSPNLALNMALAIVAGLVIAGGVAVLLEYVDDTVKSAKDVKAALGLPTLAEIGRFKFQSGEQGTLNDQSYESEREAYGVLRANMQFSTVGQEARVILITSSESREGKSTISSHYGIALAEAGKKVVVIDSDLRRPSLHKIFEIDNTVGLSSALVSNVSVDAALRKTTYENLCVITSGPLPPNPAELLDWTGFDQLVETLKERFDVVILNSPPVLAVADARIMAAKADATVLIAESGRTRAKTLQDAYEALLKTKANIVGVVLNRIRRSHSSHYHYYYYSYGTGRSRKRRKGLITGLAKSEVGAIGGASKGQSSENRMHEDSSDQAKQPKKKKEQQSR